MTISRVYQILAKVGIDADLKAEAPSGGLVQIHTHPESGALTVRCSESAALSDLFRLTRAVGTPKFSLRNLRALRSPLVQTVVVNVQDNKLLTWRPGRFPQVHGLRALLSILR